MRLRFGTPRDMKPIGPQIDTELVTRNMMARSISAFFMFESSVSPLKCRVSERDDRIATSSPIAKSISENIMSNVVTPSRLKFAAPHR